MKTLLEKRTAVFEDTIKHFKFTNRCVTLDVVVNMHRYLINQKAVPLADLSRIRHYVDYLMKKVRLSLVIKYLLDLQRLHDTGGNWDGYGLSTQGHHDAESIKAKYMF